MHAPLACLYWQSELISSLCRNFYTSRFIFNGRLYQVLKIKNFFKLRIKKVERKFWLDLIDLDNEVDDISIREMMAKVFAPASLSFCEPRLE